jgi:Asp-tRNA(Asn)/Glu-tRNA(Gln) amidotransferase A subunit family amidase
MFMDAVLSTEPWVHEPALVPLPWRKEQIVPTVTRPLRIGIMPHDGLVRPHPPISRAIEELSAKLKGLPNIEVTDISPYKTDEALAIAFSLYFSDGGEADKTVMAEAGEPMCPLVEFLFKEIPGIKKLSRQELEYWLEEREEYRLEFSEHWNKTGTWIDEEGRWNGAINALICPVGPGVANRHNTSKYFAYTSVWNLLDYPALAFPVGSVDATKDTKSMRLSFMSGHDQENWDLCKLPQRNPRLL